MKDHALRRASLIVMSAFLILIVSATAAFALATVTSVSPNALPPGATNATLIMTGNGFLVTPPTVTFTPATGITVNSTTIADTTHLNVNVTIAPNAPTGSRTVTVDDGLGTSDCSACFTVSPPPTVTGASPSSMGIGSNAKTVTLTGTGFMNGAIVGISGVGVAPTGPSTFVNGTTLKVDLSVQSTAITGARNITVTNPDGQHGTCVGCFTLTAAPRASHSGFTPAQRGPGLSNQNIEVNGTGFSSGIAVSFSGTGITVNSVNRTSSTTITINITTAGGAPLGAQDVTFTNTDGGKSTCAGCFAITGPTIVSSINTPSTLNGDIVATFSQPVGGVSSSNSFVRLTGTTTTFPTSVTCANATGVVSCNGGNATKAFLHPTLPFVAGQHYTVHIAAAGTPDVIDFGGLKVAEPTPQDFRGGLTQQGESVASASIWRIVTNSHAINGWYTMDHLAGATASYRFSGTYVTWYTIVGPNYGIADLYVDGVARATVNCYRATTFYGAAFTVSGLTASPHTLVIRVRGVRGSTSGTGTDIALDAVRANGKTIGSPSATYTWGLVKTSSASGGAYVRSDEPGSTTSFTFRGTQVEWDTVLGSGMGLASVYIDGVFKGRVDNYSATAKYSFARTYGGLTNSVHTIKIVVLGTHRAAATGSTIAIDRWVVT